MTEHAPDLGALDGAYDKLERKGALLCSAKRPDLRGERGLFGRETLGVGIERGARVVESPTTV